MVKIVGVKQTLIIANVDKTSLTHKTVLALLCIFFDCSGRKNNRGITAPAISLQLLPIVH